eukprot:gnl/Spiro4/29458_TR14432_c0_g1_i1.p1 gnl/Spiro4/29458_TR14432_c0_g1~~gnl/Spiro4/29458_TR14432_c0_g1_i1.p1  ORF type:complete len:561 (+),score=73.37 gnl/Spiro4/29458_TR14432_c0_g1_i1:158-1684(+)
MCKMMIDPFGGLLITSDGATILSNLNVQHPSGRVLVELARSQDISVGDGTTSVVLLAGELYCSILDELQRRELSMAALARGLRNACVRAADVLPQCCLALPARESLSALAFTVLNTKFCNSDWTSFLAKLVSTAIGLLDIPAFGNVERSCDGGPFTQQTNVDLRRLAVIKVPFTQPLDSYVCRGFSVSGYIVSPLSQAGGRQCRILILHDDDAAQTLVAAEHCAEALADARVRLVFSCERLAGPLVSALLSRNIGAVCGVSRADLQLATAAASVHLLPASIMSLEATIVCLDINEIRCYDSGSSRVQLVVCAPQDSHEVRGVVLVLRAMTADLLNEMHRAIIDALNVLRHAVSSAQSSLVIGGGCFEVLASIALKKAADTCELCPEERVACASLAQALLSIPSVLVENCSRRSAVPRVLAEMHREALLSEDGSCCWFDGRDGVVCRGGGGGGAGQHEYARAGEPNSVAAPLELVSTKRSVLSLAIDATIALLRIDRIVVMPHALEKRP